MRVSTLAVSALFVACPLAAQTKPNSPASAVDAQLFANTRRVWDAFKRRDVATYMSLVRAGAPSVNGGGVTAATASATDLLKDMQGCDFKRIDMSNMKATEIDANNRIVTFTVLVDATCGGTKIPRKHYVADVWSLKNGTWTSVLHTESLAEKQTDK